MWSAGPDQGLSGQHGRTVSWARIPCWDTLLEHQTWTSHVQLPPCLSVTCQDTLSGRLVLTPGLDTMLGHYIGRHMFKVTFIQTYLSDSWTCPDIMFRHHIRVVPGLHILSSCHGILSGIMSDNRILVIIYTPLGNGVLSRHHVHYGVPSGHHSGT